jgi:hypothetical protein
METWEMMNRRAASGIDGESTEHFESGLERRVEEICAQVRGGAYRAPPVRRVDIPKGPGKTGTRPLGIPTVADRLLQRAVVAAAVYAASEGLSVIVLDCRAFGGQAGASSRIENYLGFPTGISGMALMARAYNQAQKFGVEMAIPDQANRLGDGADEKSKRYLLNVGDDETVQARAEPDSRRCSVAG